MRGVCKTESVHCREVGRINTENISSDKMNTHAGSAMFASACIPACSVGRTETSGKSTYGMIRVVET